MRPLFFLGNRRSGTTLMCHLLNLHPRVYVAFERYTMWILYHIYRTGRADGFVAPERGVPYPMWITLGHAHKEVGMIGQVQTDGIDIYRRGFYNIVTKCVQVRKDGKGKSLLWVGEKNPPEYSDPEVYHFINMVHPDAKYLHIVRHPGNCVGSKMKCAEKWDLHHPLWMKPVEELFEDWLLHEQWVCNIRANGSPVLTIKYEDLCKHPAISMGFVQDFLELEEPFVNLDAVRPDRDSQYDLEVPPHVMEFAARYGY